MTVPLIAATAPAGPEGAPLLLLGPSLGTSTILWDAAAALLQSRYRTVSWDLPGHGRSPAPSEPFSMAELADAVARVLDELGESHALFAGVSMGGAVGLELLLGHPDRIDAAAIICSGAVIGTPAGWTERAAVARSTGTASLVVPSAQRWFAPDSMARSPEITGRLLHSLRDADDEGYARCCEALAGYDVRSQLGRITAPVLAVWGEYDEVTPEASAAQIASGVARGRVAEVRDAGHLAPAEQPERIAELLIAHFEESR
ncbi:alpha/beta fold hydrolase [Lysinimonas soli]|uniref:Alpha/beta fold hydrolase n=1 Tax=Lysinimonas soli TaxID=1074233 RepID=A0ABW0NQZ4_9MICO